MAGFNPWATRKVASKDTPATPIADTPEYATALTDRYAAPSLEAGSPYNDEFGWANRGKDTLRPSAVDYPSAQRLQVIPRHDMWPDPVRAPEEYYRPRDLDEKKRHSVEDQDADGWGVHKGITGQDLRWEDSPRRKPPAETRITEILSPSTYRFTRPWDQDFAKTFNGNHFSMADHRRNYEVSQYGMAPQRTPRNTYRLEPLPWDTHIVDVPPPARTAYATSTGSDVPSASRSWRLT